MNGNTLWGMIIVICVVITFYNEHGVMNFILDRWTMTF